MAGSSLLICIPSSYRFSPPTIASFFSRYRALAEGARSFLYICDAGAHLIYVFVTLDMVNSDKVIGEIMLVVCSHPLFTKLYLQNVRAYGWVFLIIMT